MHSIEIIENLNENIVEIGDHCGKLYSLSLAVSVELLLSLLILSIVCSKFLLNELKVPLLVFSVTWIDKYGNAMEFEIKVELKEI